VMACMISSRRLREVKSFIWSPLQSA